MIESGFSRGKSHNDERKVIIYRTLAKNEKQCYTVFGEF